MSQISISELLTGLLVFATLLRLRQICVHPILIQEQADEDGYIHGDEEGYIERELARAKRLVSEDFVTRMKKKFKEIADERVAAEMSQVCGGVSNFF